MKFILHIEDEGYQLRFWDEISESVGEAFVTNWEEDVLYEEMTSKGFIITKKELSKAISMLDERPFVVLKSKEGVLDTFLNETFTIDKELTDG